MFLSKVYDRAAALDFSSEKFPNLFALTQPPWILFRKRLVRQILPLTTAPQKTSILVMILALSMSRINQIVLHFGGSKCPQILQ